MRAPPNNNISKQLLFIAKQVDCIYSSVVIIRHFASSPLIINLYYHRFTYFIDLVTMGKHEPMSAKAIANKIKAKGLQKIKYYCEMCKKQCRDDNGFKCHLASESHQRQAMIVSQNPEQFVGEFSKQFADGFMYILKTRYRSARVLANTVYQEYIKDREHTHLNATRWLSLTEFAEWLGENGMAEVEHSNAERGVMITYIDRDPETLRRQELEAKRAEQAKEAAIKNQKEIERQMESAKRLYQQFEKEKPLPEPVPIVKYVVQQEEAEDDVKNEKGITNEEKPLANNEPSTSCDESNKADQTRIIERPKFSVGTISLKTMAKTSYKPPPPKRKVLKKPDGAKKKVKTS